MEIRKLFKFEMAHIVRGAWSRRCAYNIHGHSYKLEIFINGLELDDSGMVIDFGLVKNMLNDFIDSFDHTMLLQNLEDDKEIIEFLNRNFERVIITDWQVTAEYMALMFLKLGNSLLKNNCNKDIIINKVIVHETDTGYAVARINDITSKESVNIKWKGIRFSDEIKKDWKNKYIEKML